MKKTITILSTFFVASCATGNTHTIEQLSRRVAHLEESNENLVGQINSIRECEEWRNTYIREGLNCVQGLQPETMQELYHSEGSITEETVTTRRENACRFSCAYEVQCQHTRRDVCALIGFDAETPEEETEGQ
jgi:hypothetical protein